MILKRILCIMLAFVSSIIYGKHQLLHRYQQDYTFDVDLQPLPELRTVVKATNTNNVHTLHNCWVTKEEAARAKIQIPIVTIPMRNTVEIIRQNPKGDEATAASIVLTCQQL